MRILATVDTHPYSAGIINNLARLAANTWADVTLLALQPAMPDQNQSEDPLLTTLFQYQDEFFSLYQEGDLPYARARREDLRQVEAGRWEADGHGRKELILKARARDKDPVRSILSEAREQECDLIILGCGKGNDCQWEGEIDLPQKVARDADCSVLVIKEEKTPEKITCCLDQDHVSQESLEMINQIVTLHQADLKIVGLTGPKGLPGKGEVERKMDDVWRYYTYRGVRTLIQLVDRNDLEKFVDQATMEGLIALWMGKKSLLKKIFSKDLVGRLVATSHSSVLILR